MLKLLIAAVIVVVWLGGGFFLGKQLEEYQRHHGGRGDWDVPLMIAAAWPFGWSLIILAAGSIFGPLNRWPFLRWLLN